MDKGEQFILVPSADRGRLRAALWLKRQGGRSGALGRALRNHDQMPEVAALIGLVPLAFASFVLLLLAVIFDPQMALADAAIGQFVQGLGYGLGHLGDAGYHPVG